MSEVTVKGTDIQERPLIRIEHLKKYFHVTGKGELHAVDDISLDIMENETLGLVGESGCGKSTVGNVLMQLLDATDGHIRFGELELVKASRAQKKEYTQMAQMIFQDPYMSLNPRKTIKSTLEVPFRIQKVPEKEIEGKILALIKRVGLEEYVLAQYPHELDGGKRQMVGIARALAMNPKFIVCDEPVSALDVSVQATIINLLIDMQKEMGFTYLFISHDLSVVRHISNRVAVMYLGQVVELASTDEIFENTLHPYSIALLSAVPKVNDDSHQKRIVLNGDVPSPMNPKEGCRFAPRCWMCSEECKTKGMPTLTDIGDGHYVACHRWKESRKIAEEIQ